MSCLFSCFRAAKNKPKRRSFSRKLSDDPVNNDTCSAFAHNVPQQLRSQHSVERRDKVENEGRPDIKKNVTFELNVTSYDNVRSEGVVENLEQEEGEKETKEKVFPVNHRYHHCEGIDDEDDVAIGDDDYELEGDEEGCGLCDEGVDDAQVVKEMKGSTDCGDSDDDGEIGGDEEDCGLCDEDVDDAQVVEENKGSCVVIGPEKTNNRYSNCEDSDDDVEMEVDDEDCELVDEYVDDGEVVDGAEDEEPNKSIVEEKKGSHEVCSPEIESYSGSDEVNLGTVLQKSDSHYQSQNVLNPVENLTRWKRVNLQSVAPAKDCLSKDIRGSDIENKVPADSKSLVKEKRQEWSVDSKATPCYSAKRDVSVDASLSTWLVSSDNSTVEGPQESGSRLSNSSFSREERPILGALTVDDIKHLSATSTPRKSPSRSPDETPIIGSVGRYWNSSKQRDYDTGYSRKSGCDFKGIPNTTSKYREDRKVNWHSTPFEVRLERALNKGRT